jgi:hypothetical protein
MEYLTQNQRTKLFLQLGEKLPIVAQGLGRFPNLLAMKVAT